MLHTGNTTVDTNVDASQTTTVHAGDIYTHTVANSITTTSAVAGPINSLSAALATNTIKAAILDLQIAVLGVSASLQVAATAKMHVGPMDSVQIGPQVSKSAPGDIAMHMMRTLLAGATIDERNGAGHIHLAPLHSIG